jgi:sulfur carrier protein ThiS
MRVSVRLYGSLRRLSQPETPGLWQGELPPGNCLRDLIAVLGTKEAEVAAAAIDGRLCPLERELEDGMSITLVPHVGGG